MLCNGVFWSGTDEKRWEVDKPFYFIRITSVTDCSPFQYVQITNYFSSKIATTEYVESNSQLLLAWYIQPPAGRCLDARSLGKFFHQRLVQQLDFLSHACTRSSLPVIVLTGPAKGASAMLQRNSSKLSYSRKCGSASSRISSIESLRLRHRSDFHSLPVLLFFGRFHFPS